MFQIKKNILIIFSDGSSVFSNYFFLSLNSKKSKKVFKKDLISLQNNDKLKHWTKLHSSYKTLYTNRLLWKK